MKNDASTDRRNGGLSSVWTEFITAEYQLIRSTIPNSRSAPFGFQRRATIDSSATATVHSGVFLTPNNQFYFWYHSAMASKALFEGLVFDEYDRPVDLAYVGDEPCYVVDDDGFRRHISSEQVDRQVLDVMHQMIEGHEEIVGEQAAKMLGTEDIFSVAMLVNQLKQIESQFDALLETGIPAEARAYMGMMGFKVRINLHGDVIDIEQPGITDSGHEE